MARLIMLVLFMLLVTSVTMALKTCSAQQPSDGHATGGDASGLVSLQDGSTMIAQPGTVGRDLVDWLAERKPGEKTFELGGQEFVGRTAQPTSESLGRVTRLIAMLRANPDVRMTIVGHSDPSGDERADIALSLARAQALYRLVRDGGIAPARLEVQARGSSDPLAPNDSPVNRARNQRVSLVLSRKE
ncbi:OmpA family protein [Sphingobium olei]|uniref:OmpA family protein n=1 Tax=Sphingobium olei TaxID=420955 RepID=A0ABW3NYQ8_9SPHN